MRVQLSRDDTVARNLRRSRRFFAATSVLALIGALALAHSFANWESGWVLGSPGNAIWITGLCALMAAPCSLISLAFGLPLIRRKPVVLLWVLPLSVTYLAIAAAVLGT